MKIPVEKKAMQKTAQLPLSALPPGSLEQMSGWLQKGLKFTPGQVTQLKSRPAEKIVLAGREIMQSER